jgi:hypothetical protein
MKTEVYSWRLSPQLKRDLERAARDEGVPISGLLERISQDWLAERRREDEAAQARIWKRVERCIGAISMGGGPWTNDKVRKVIQDRLAKKYDRERSH